eukprot:gene28813-32003_t
MEDDERCSKSIEGRQYNISKVEGRVTWLSDFEAAFKDIGIDIGIDNVDKAASCSPCQSMSAHGTPKQPHVVNFVSAQLADAQQELNKAIAAQQVFE